MESNVTELPIHDRLLAWFETHKKESLWGVAVVLVVGLGIGFFLWRENERQAGANEALSRILGRSSTSSELPLLPETFLKVTAEHPNTDAGSRALLLAAASSFSRGRYADAKAQFESFRRDYHDSPLVNQALLGVAACLDAQGKTGEAVTVYNDILQHYSTDNVAVQAKLALAGLHEKQGKWEQARDAYSELIRANMGSISSEAGMHLGELFARHPELAPTKQSSTNPPAFALPKP